MNVDDGIATFINSQAEQLRRALAALQAQEDAENGRDKCPDCEGEGEWWKCGHCSETFGGAIELRRSILTNAPPAPTSERVQALEEALRDILAYGVDSWDATKHLDAVHRARAALKATP